MAEDLASAFVAIAVLYSIAIVLLAPRGYTGWRILRCERAPAAEAANNVVAAPTSVAISPTEKRPPMAPIAAD